jgi:hypothetical protein
MEAPLESLFEPQRKQKASQWNRCEQGADLGKRTAYRCRRLREKEPSMPFHLFEVPARYPFPEMRAAPRLRDLVTAIRPLRVFSSA